MKQLFKQLMETYPVFDMLLQSMWQLIFATFLSKCFSFLLFLLRFFLLFPFDFNHYEVSIRY